MEPEDPHRLLGVDPGADEETIRRAYARAVRRFPPEQDPVGFSRIRRAYEQLRASVGRAVSPGADPASSLLREAAVLEQQGKLLRAGAVLKRALVLYPGNRLARLAFVQNLQARGRHRDAVREIDRLLRQHPGDPELLLLGAKARRLWAEMPGSTPRRIRRLVQEACNLLDAAPTPDASAPVERVRLHLLEGSPERALEVLEPIVPARRVPGPREVELLVLACLIHLDRRDRAAYRAAVGRLEQLPAGHPARSLAGLQLACEAARRAERGDLATLASLVQAAEKMAGEDPRVAEHLEVPRDLQALLSERQQLPLEMAEARRLLGLEIDYLRLPAGKDGAVLKHWGEVTVRLRALPAAARHRQLLQLRAHCPTFCRRNAGFLADLEEHVGADDCPF